MLKSLCPPFCFQHHMYTVLPTSLHVYWVSHFSNVGCLVSIVNYMEVFTDTEQRYIGACTYVPTVHTTVKTVVILLILVL